MLIDALAVAGVYTGVLGVSWLIIAPTFCCWGVLCVNAALRGRKRGPYDTGTVIE